MAKFMPNVRISSVHGKSSWVNGRLVVAMFHPAAALHQPSLKTAVIEDFNRLPEFLKIARTNRDKMQALRSEPVVDAEENSDEDKPTQLSLF
jgi:DNA polymerase